MRHGVASGNAQLRPTRAASAPARVPGGHSVRVAADETGVSFSAELPEQRNSQADPGPAAILRDHLDRPITGIALDLGFSEASTVSRLLRARLDPSPIRYRQQEVRR